MGARWGPVPLFFSLAGACGGNGGFSPTQGAGAIDAGPDATLGASSDAARETPDDAFREVGEVGIDAAVGAQSGPDAAVNSLPDTSSDVASEMSADGARDASLGGFDSSVDAGDGGRMQSIAIPLYVDPGSSPAAWSQVNAAAPVVALLVANPASGPGSAAANQYTNAIRVAHGSGQSIVGYVHTSWGMRPIADVRTEVDSWYSFYPAIDGIFYDEASTDPTTIPTYYQPIHDYVKAKNGQRIVVINPGTLVGEAFMQAADIVMTFEDTFANYTSNYPPNPAWIQKYPPWRFWHLVLSATTLTDMQSAISNARGRNVGYVYVTDQPPATAYQTLVSGAYWQSELAIVK
jgi:hypothetical protein